MMNYLGTSQWMTVKEITTTGFLLMKNDVTVLLKRENSNRLHFEVGERVEVFIYSDHDHSLAATTTIPKARVDHYHFATVTNVRKDLGVFVDIGIEKDMVVSMDDLPALTHLWPKKGDRLMVTLEVDKKERIWGKLAGEHEMKAISQKASADLFNQNLSGTVYRLLKIGSFVLTDEHYIGFIHESERMSEPRLGEYVNARVIAVKPNGTLNLSLRGRIHETLDDDAEMILTYLRSVGGEMGFGDKSEPNAIRAKFGISKAQFKRALGHLMKKGLIMQQHGVITKLMKSEENLD